MIRMAAVSSMECAYFSKCWAITGKPGFIYLWFPTYVGPDFWGEKL
jgi:hypothetical protein